MSSNKPPKTAADSVRPEERARSTPNSRVRPSPEPGILEHMVRNQPGQHSEMIECLLMR
jgi:hypothetical protein